MANSASSVDLPNANIALRSISRHFIVALQCFDVVYRHRLLMSPCDSSVSASHFCRFFLLPTHFFPFKNKGFEPSRQIPPPHPRVTSVPFPRGGSLLAVRGRLLPWRSQVSLPAGCSGGGRVPGRQPAGLLFPRGTPPSRWRVLLSPHPSPQREQPRGCRGAGTAAAPGHASPRREPPPGRVTRCPEPSRPLAAARSEPAFCCQRLPWAQGPCNEIALACGCCGAASTRAEGQGQERSPGRAPGSSAKIPAEYDRLPREPLHTLRGLWGQQADPEMEKPGSDCPVRQSPAVNAADSRRACVFSGRVMGSESLGSSTQTHSPYPSSHWIFLSKINS